MRRLQRMVHRQEKLLRLQQTYLELVEQLEHPLMLVPQETPGLDFPPLTEAEIQELKDYPMPDPMEEIEHRLGLSTSPPSPRTWAD